MPLKYCSCALSMIRFLSQNSLLFSLVLLEEELTRFDLLNQ